VVGHDSLNFRQQNWKVRAVDGRCARKANNNVRTI
jgi:hypothetical protein